MNVKLSEAQKKAAISSPSSIAQIMQQILMRENKLGRSQEHFWVIGLNNAGELLFVELIGLGRQNRVNANPPDVFRMAIYKLAMKLVLVHNHPSGNLAPSAADKAFTDRIIKVGEIINVDVIDHIIISETQHASLAEMGIIAELKKSDTWRIVEKEDAEMQQLKQNFEKKETERIAKRNEKIKVAKILKAKGMDEISIKEVTGLSVSVIRKM